MGKLIIATMIAVSSVFCCHAKEAITHSYKFKVRNWVPRIYDNMSSLGYRKYKLQQIDGVLDIEFTENNRPSIVVSDLVNKSHKINGKNITYTAKVNNDGDFEGPMTRVNLIGDNKTGKFTTASVVFYIDAEPSYNIGEDNEDNSLICTFAGKGTTSTKTIKAWERYTYTDNKGKTRSALRQVTLGKYRIITTLRGYDAGTLGCGCYAYGHTSPTRVAGALGPTDFVDDVASTWGAWRATYLQTYYIP